MDKMSSETRTTIARQLGMMGDGGVDLSVNSDVADDALAYILSLCYYAEVVGTEDGYTRTYGILWWKRVIAHRPAMTYFSCAFNSEMFNLREARR